MSETKSIARPLDIGQGALVLVVGPSGAGKDTLIAHARTALAGDPRFVFVRRVVTRVGDAASEDHLSMSNAAFEAAVAAGGFPLHWRAHGLGYGIPASAFGEVAAGRIAVANASRGVIDAARLLVKRLAVAHVKAPPEILAERLARRGREDAQTILRRLQREAPQVDTADAIDIVNNGTVEAAAERLVALLQSLAGNATIVD